MHPQLSGHGHQKRNVSEISPAPERRNDIAVTLHALWAGEHTAVYLAYSMKAIVVRHGAAPLKEAEYVQVVDMMQQTCRDIGLRTVLIDFRAVPSQCDCGLCESQGFPDPVVIAAAQELGADELARGLRSFCTFDAAVRFVRPKHLLPSSVPCPWGFERIMATVQEQGGAIVFGNYAGAVFQLPRHKAVYIQWSGDVSDEAAFSTVLDVADKCVAKMQATYLILDHRNRVDLSAAMRKKVLIRSLAPSLFSVTHAISIGEWPRKDGSPQNAFRPSIHTGWHVSNVHTLKEALQLIRASSHGRRDRRLKQAA